MSNPIEEGSLTEKLRQERETFDQHKAQEAKWFALRLSMGWLGFIMLPSILVISVYIIFNYSQFPGVVVTSAAGALFCDVLGLIGAVWKIVLNPGFMTRIAPVTSLGVTGEDTIQVKSNLNDDSKNALLILSAVYGTKDVSNDVTETIRTKIKNNQLEFQVNNYEMGGDPHPKKRKTLNIKYTWKGKTCTKVVSERDILKLP